MNSSHSTHLRYCREHRAAQQIVKSQQATFSPEISGAGGCAFKRVISSSRCFSASANRMAPSFSSAFSACKADPAETKAPCSAVSQRCSAVFSSSSRARSDSACCAAEASSSVTLLCKELTLGIIGYEAVNCRSCNSAARFKENEDTGAAYGTP